MANSSVLQIILKAVNQTNSAFNELRGNLNSINKAQSEMGGAVFNQTAQLKKMTAAAKGTATGFKSIATSVMKFAATSAAISISAKKLYAFAEAGAMGSRVMTAGAKTALYFGQNMSEISTAVVDASLGAISMKDAIQGVSQAMMFGLRGGPEQFGELMEIAAVRARAFGLSTDQAFSDIVRGIGRMSPLILDNIGITIDAANTYEAYAASIGKAASELSSIEKRQALFNRVITEGRDYVKGVGGITWDTAAAYEFLGAKAKDAGQEVGGFFGKLFAGVGSAAKIGELSATLLKDFDFRGPFAPEDLRKSEVGKEEYYKQTVEYLQNLITNFKRVRAREIMERMPGAEKSMFAMQTGGEIAVGGIGAAGAPVDMGAVSELAIKMDLVEAQEKYVKALKDAKNTKQRTEVEEKYNATIKETGFALMTQGLTMESNQEQILNTARLYGQMTEQEYNAAASAANLTKAIEEQGLTWDEAQPFLDRFNSGLSSLMKGGRSDYFIYIWEIRNGVLGATPGSIFGANASTRFAPSYSRALGGGGLVNVGANVGEHGAITNAYGGGIGAYSTSLVGERGPELFTPTSSGRITPNNQLGGGANINVNLTYAPMISTANRAELENELMPFIKEGVKKALDVQVL